MVHNIFQRHWLATGEVSLSQLVTVLYGIVYHVKLELDLLKNRCGPEIAGPFMAGTERVCNAVRALTK